ncbi:MAG TPA: sensor histidine kinase [Micromonosporaceae bacterium]
MEPVLAGGTRDRRSVWTLSGVLADLALAAGLLALGFFATPLAGRNQPDAVPVDGLAYVLIAAAVAPLVVRRRWPLTALAVCTAAVSAYLVAGYPYGPILLTYVLAMYTVAVRLPTRRAAVAGAASLAALSAHIFVTAGPAPGIAGLLPASAWTVVPFALGVTVRVNREAAARRRADQARRQADDERLRIAQEVHDVVGHGLAAINMQAEIALHLLPKRPEQAETALAAISRTSREALDELRVTLAVVRRGAERQPAPGLGQVPELRDRLAAAGLPVTVEVSGEPRDLPAAVDLAGYRVVQESLTNVLRHAGEATAAVRIEYRPAEVAVEVADTGRAGPGESPAAGGHGLAGMRERVTALGGDLAAGPRPGGGFRVYARIPAEPRP